MIDDLRKGDLVVAYNVLGSYAQVQAEQSDDLVVILPSEFPTTMMRTVLVSAHSGSPQRAGSFVRHLLALQDKADPRTFPLPSLKVSPAGDLGPTISLEPALMTYLDAMKKAAFMREWENALVQSE